MRKRGLAWRREPDDAFARIAASLGDPEWRRIRSAILVTSVAVVTAAIAVFVLLSPTGPEVLIGFLVTFVVGIMFASAILKRPYRPRR